MNRLSRLASGFDVREALAEAEQIEWPRKDDAREALGGENAPTPPGYSVIGYDTFGPALCALLAIARANVPRGKTHARVTRLPAGRRIKPHKDGLGRGHMRYHLPLRSDRAAVFRLGLQRAPFLPGELWRCDLGNRVHELRNDSDQDKICLIFDVER